MTENISAFWRLSSEYIHIILSNSSLVVKMVKNPPTTQEMEAGDSHDSYQATGRVREHSGTLIYTHPFTSKAKLGKLRERRG